MQRFVANLVLGTRKSVERLEHDLRLADRHVPGGAGIGIGLFLQHVLSA